MARNACVRGVQPRRRSKPAPSQQEGSSGLRGLGYGLGEIWLDSSVAVRFRSWWLDFGRAALEGHSGFQKLVVAQGVLKR